MGLGGAPGNVAISGEELLERAPVAFDSSRLAAGLAGRRILVAGAGGSVGSALSERLAALRPAELVLLDSHEPSLFRLRSRLLAGWPDGQYRWALADVRDERKLAALFRQCRPQVVFHLAACKQVPLGEENVDQVFDVNVLGTVGLVRQATLAGVGTVVYPSTDKAVNPPSVYGASKRVVERYLAVVGRRGDAVTPRVVRLVNVFGTQGSVIETFARQILAGDPITITDLRMTRYWMTMRETVDLLAWVARSEGAADSRILDVGQPVPLEATARRLGSILRPEAEITIRCVGIRPGERLSEELTYSYERLDPTAHPGVRAIRDTRGPAAFGGDLEAGIQSLSDELYDLERAELRKRLFALAAGEQAS